jgi:hypothetical protein
MSTNRSLHTSYVHYRKLLKATKRCNEGKRLKEAVQSALPRGHELNLLAFAVDQIPVKLTTASVDIHLGNCEPSLALPEVTGNPEGANDEESEVRLEELVRGTSLDTRVETKRRDGSVELSPN